MHTRTEPARNRPGALRPGFVRPSLDGDLNLNPEDCDRDPDVKRPPEDSNGHYCSPAGRDLVARPAIPLLRDAS